MQQFYELLDYQLLASRSRADRHMKVAVAPARTFVCARCDAVGFLLFAFSKSSFKAPSTAADVDELIDTHEQSTPPTYSFASIGTSRRTGSAPEALNKSWS